MVKSFMFALALFLLAVAGVWLVWVKSAHGFSARAQPSWIESRLAGLSRLMALPGGANRIRNPYPATAVRLAAARQLFATQCALCHNQNGDGRTTLGQSLFPKPPDLRGPILNKTDGAIFYSIRNGIRMSGMPAWPQDSDEEIWGLVSLMRTQRSR